MKAKLKDLGKISTGNTPSKNISEFYNSEDIGFVKPDIISELQIDYIENTTEYLAEAARSKARIVKKNTVFVTCIGNIGKIGIVKDKELAFNQQINAIEPNEKVLPKYLAYGIFANKRRLQAISNAPVVPIINKTQFGEFEIDIIDDTKEQLKIAELLDKVSEVIANRKKELEKLDDLIKARFIELFGDTENNPFSWEKTKIGTVIQSCEAGWSGNGVQREKRDGEVAVLKVSAVTKGYFIPEECKVLDDQRNIKKYIFPEKGDLLFSRANTREMVGATAIVTQDYPEHILPDKLWKIRFTDDADVYYMKYVLSSNSIRSMFSAVSTGTSGSMYNVSMEKFKSITIPLPPRKLQNQFAAFVKQVNKSKFAVQKALDNAQLLFDSLMQKYFG